MTLTELTPSFVSDDELNDNLCPWKPWLLSPSHPMLLNSESSFSRTVLEHGSFAMLPCPSTQTDIGFCLYGNGHTMQRDHASASGQDTRRATVLLDKGRWSPSPPSFVTPYAPSESHVAFMDVRSHASLPCLDRGSNGFPESLSFDGTPAPDIEVKSQVILHTQPVPDLSSGFSSLDLCSTEDRANFLNDETQPPAVLYHPQGKKGLGRRRCQRASAINIEGLWIDKDDLCSIVGQGSSTVSVHECQWSKTSNPCGMWIVGSRARIGAHVRKWHRPTHEASRTQCLWDSCTEKAMRKDSISRHVVTVHLGEGFHCQGCNEEFSRKDVYDQHVRKGELCRDAGAVMVYCTERRVIDTRKALQHGDVVRYSD